MKPARAIAIGENAWVPPCMLCANNTRQIALAVQTHECSYRVLPPDGVARRVWQTSFDIGNCDGSVHSIDKHIAVQLIRATATLAGHENETSTLTNCHWRT